MMTNSMMMNMTMTTTNHDHNHDHDHDNDLDHDHHNVDTMGAYSGEPWSLATSKSLKANSILG